MVRSKGVVKRCNIHRVGSTHRRASLGGSPKDGCSKGQDAGWAKQLIVSPRAKANLFGRSQVSGSSNVDSKQSLEDAWAVLLQKPMCDELKLVPQYLRGHLLWPVQYVGNPITCELVDLLGGLPD